ncbi:MAG: carboxypeptidase-like regulatory domain-containing protein [Fimbriimonadaceae bacterium]|nr:carboxypeptidase-like regulatory domain-containing protein [Fimbriimonadaceae bacterium]
MIRSSALSPLVLAGCALALAGCTAVDSIGDPVGPPTASLTGQVLDLNSQPVRGATVKVGERSTVTSAAGTYQLTGVNSGVRLITAEATQNGVLYKGRTMAVLNPDSQRSNGVIVVAAQGNLGVLRGTVRDRDGFLLSGVPVFAYSGAGAAARGYTDKDGEFELRDLPAPLTYEVRAMAAGYRADFDNITVRPSGAATVNFVLSNGGFPSLPAPTGLGVVTWVSVYPGRADRSGIDWAKARAFPGERASTIPLASSRALRSDLAIEANLTWDEVRFSDHYGWGIYRGTGTSGAVNGLELNVDMLSAYFQDLGLNPFSFYRYGVTTLGSNFDQFPAASESPLSALVTAETLGRLDTLAPTAGSFPTFRWTAGSGADEYVVFLFDRFPTVNVDALWTSSRVTGLSTNYTGPALDRTRTHYVMVLGLANGTDSRTLSDLRSFTP